MFSAAVTVGSKLEPCVLGALCFEPSAATGPSEVAAMSCPAEAAALPDAFVYPGQASGSSDGLHAGTTARDLRMSSAIYNCVHCGDPLHKNEAYVDVDDVSIVGGFNLICRACWNDRGGDVRNMTDWRRQCRTRWLQRACRNDEHYETRVRWPHWDAAVVERNEPHPGESPTVYRERQIRKSTRLAVGMTASTFMLRADQQVDLFKVIDHWVDQWSNRVQDPDYVTAMDCDESIGSRFMDFVDHVLPGQDVYFICRQKHCSMLCLSTHWIHNHPNGQYRCPACGEQYRPWKELPGYWRTNKVWLTYDEVSPQAGRAELAPGSMDDLAHTNQVMILPVMWPDETGVHDVVDRIRAILLDIDRDLSATPPEDRLGFVLEHLSLTAPTRAFERHPFLPEVKAAIDWLNAQQAPLNKKTWQYDHIEQDGYIGIKIGPEHDLDEPMEQVDILRAWGSPFGSSRVLPPAPWGYMP